MAEKTKVTPCTCFFHDDTAKGLRIEVQLPGVDKKDISLEMRKDSFCVTAPRQDSEYSGCFMLSHEVEPERAEATYENGLLKIFSPIRDWEHKVNVMIH
jgi:HSP20 family protein